MSSSVHILFILIFNEIFAFDSAPPSPCPEFFVYRMENDVWIGKLRVDISDIQFPIRVKLEFGLKAVLKSRYVGVINLSEPVETVLDNIINRGVREIVYIIRFPLPFPLPILKAIYLQGKLVCPGFSVIGNVVTDIYLQHKFPTSYPSINFKTTQPDRSCGRCRGRCRTGNRTDIEEWPWLAAILIMEGHGALRFHCGGNLITSRHLITAGHCVKNQKEHLTKEDFIIYLGKHNLLKWGEPNSQIRYVKKIFLHHDYSIHLYKSDLAIMQLDEDVEINGYVSPVCLWSGTTSLSPLIGKLGTVVGWGKDRGSDKINARPRMFRLPLVGQEECLRSRWDFTYITSDKTFCAGWRNGSGPCNGDSGSGFIVNAKNFGENVWELRGIVSLSLVDETNYTCDLSEYQVFTDIAKFKKWILRIIEY